jgi:hypothetical protein
MYGGVITHQRAGGRLPSGSRTQRRTDPIRPSCRVWCCDLADAVDPVPTHASPAIQAIQRHIPVQLLDTGRKYSRVALASYLQGCSELTKYRPKRLEQRKSLRPKGACERRNAMRPQGAKLATEMRPGPDMQPTAHNLTMPHSAAAVYLMIAVRYQLAR